MKGKYANKAGSQFPEFIIAYMGVKNIVTGKITMPIKTPSNPKAEYTTDKITKRPTIPHPKNSIMPPVPNNLLISAPLYYYNDSSKSVFF